MHSLRELPDAEKNLSYFVAQSTAETNRRIAQFRVARLRTPHESLTDKGVKTRTLIDHRFARLIQPISACSSCDWCLLWRRLSDLANSAKIPVCHLIRYPGHRRFCRSLHIDEQSSSLRVTISIEVLKFPHFLRFLSY
jgi:hypothetical protein